MDYGIIYIIMVLFKNVMIFDVCKWNGKMKVINNNEEMKFWLIMNMICNEK